MVSRRALECGDMVPLLIYKNVRSMAGGLKAWKAAGLPTTT
jgi:rhodanese-related sulfurtransferase